MSRPQSRKRADSGLIDKAVIDVGSNSVRLVVFRTRDTFFQPIFNEKVMAALGRGVMETGKLNAPGVAMAIATLKRFQRILKARGIGNVLIVATAAVRIASDGPAFIEQVKRQTGLEIKVICGEEEARISAMGVIAGVPEASGLIGDLGGSSLELVPVGKGRVKRGISLPLGPLAVRIDGQSFDPASFDLNALRDCIDTQLDKAVAQFNGENSDFYVVGGAWRALAMVHMNLRGHPLRVLHQYTISRDDAFELAHLVETQSPQSLLRIPGVSSRRTAFLPYAALLLERVLQRQLFKTVTVSAYGLREGLLYDQLPSKSRTVHPVLAGVKALAQQNWSSAGFGAAVERWIKPVSRQIGTPFAGKRTELLNAAACRLADIGSRLHPDHREQIAFDLILYAPYPGLSHAERAALALCVFYRYAGDKKPPNTGLIGQVVSDKQKKWALALGLTLRCAAAISGRTSKLLKRTHLEVQGEQLHLNALDDDQDLFTEQVIRYRQDMTKALGLRWHD